MGGIIPNPISTVKGLYNDAKDVVNTGANVASDVVDTGSNLVSDGIHLSDEALHDATNFDENFVKGAGDWATGLASTFGDLVTHPVDTLKTVGKIATNPILNPLAAPIDMAVDAAQGKNPLDAYKDGANQIKDIGVGLYDNYKQEYDKHGVAGLLGNAAPDVALAVLTDGASAEGEAGAEVAAKATAETVAKEAAQNGAKDLVKTGAKGLLPDEKTVPQVVDQQRQQNDNSSKPDSKPAPPASHYNVCRAR